MRRRPRIAFKLLVFLMLGAVINVSVAYCVVRYSSSSTDLFSAQIMGSLSKSLSEGDSPTRYVLWVDQNFGIRRCSEPGEDAIRQFTVTVAVGWPTLSFHSWSSYEDNKLIRSRERHIDMPDRKLMFGLAKKELPLMPRMPGFAINTIFYAAIVWGLFAIGGVPGYIKRKRRIKRGLCVKCAYPVGTNEKCTECGTPV